MARKPRKVWKEWELKLGCTIVKRFKTGVLSLISQSCGTTLTPSEARRLYTKLASDFRD